jgi:hypothetical protein
MYSGENNSREFFHDIKMTEDHDSDKPSFENKIYSSKVIHCRVVSADLGPEEKSVTISSGDTVGDIINSMIQIFHLESHRGYLRLCLTISNNLKVSLIRTKNLIINTHINMDTGSHRDTLMLLFTSNDKFGELCYENINMFDSISEDAHLQIFSY